MSSGSPPPPSPCDQEKRYKSERTSWRIERERYRKPSSSFRSSPDRLKTPIGQSLLNKKKKTLRRFRTQNDRSRRRILKGREGLRHREANAHRPMTETSIDKKKRNFDKKKRNFEEAAIAFVVDVVQHSGEKIDYQRSPVDVRPQCLPHRSADIRRENTDKLETLPARQSSG